MHDARPGYSRGRPLVAAALLGAALAATAADYAREERWAQEVVPALVVGDAMYLATPSRPKVLAIYTAPAGVAKVGVVVVHGIGVNPDWELIGVLRSELAERGYSTLSVQMPVLAAGASRDEYRWTWPEAGERIEAAIAHLRRTGVGRVAVVAHSMGATMVNAYLARSDAARIDAWVPIGMAGAFAAAPRQPVLDVVAERELEIVAQTAPSRVAALPGDSCSRQVSVAGADHYFARRESDLVATVAAFLDRVSREGCVR
jgi:pimeloyl-ACP methyl ester carboxylesterase